LPAEVRLFDDPDELGGALAAEILRRYEGAEGPFLLGCPGGRSLVPTYRALAAAQPRLPRLTVVMMDQYLGVPPDAHYCCLGFARGELAGPLGLREEQVWLPDPDDPEAYDARIEALGGIDLFLLASGASDGHVAFVAPGAPRSGRTAVMALAESTRRDNLATFPKFRSLEDVPVAGVSVGLGTIMGAQTLRLVLTGAGKRSATSRLLGLEAFDPEWPASIVHDHPDAEIWIDRKAHG
jgi:glucosamine-6-phosphate deaminase